MEGAARQDRKGERWPRAKAIRRGARCALVCEPLGAEAHPEHDAVRAPPWQCV